jgi:hypothetical protein
MVACRSKAMTQSAYYALEQGNWIRKPRMLEKRWFSAASQLYHGILVTGGTNNDFLKSTEYFSNSLGYWVSFADLPVPMRAHCQVTVGSAVDSVIVAGKS